LFVLQPDAGVLSQLQADIRNFIHVYSHEHALTARAIARVLHGIDSPRFPAAVWGKVRRFWRAQLHVHFHVVQREAARALLQFRGGLP
jgi:ATP-dependent DNA helicase Q4